MNYWKLFKNLLHNDLQITKEDIQEMIRLEVRNQIQAIVDGRNGPSIEAMARSEIRSHIEYRVNHKVINDLAQQVKDHVKINFTTE